MAKKVELPLSRKLASYLIYTEAFVMFFLSLVLFGLKILPPVLAFAGGAALFLLYLVVGRMQHYDWAYALAWALQLTLISLGLLVQEMYIIGSIFLIIWVYSMVKARQIERQQPNQKS